MNRLRYFFIMNIKWVILCGLSLLGFAYASINKTRLCVEYDIPNHWAKDETLLMIVGLTQSRCMATCVRQPLCRAFNFHSTDGTCRLLPKSPSCMTPNITEGWLYVALSTCRKHQPWRAMIPADDGWRWVALPDNPATRDDIVQFTSRFICRIYHKGLYVPGWWAAQPGQGVFRGAIPQERKRLDCAIGKCLVLLDPSRFAWTPIDIEDHVPGNAVIGGYDADSTPLYIARKLIDSTMMPGFYNAARKMLVIIYNRYSEYTTGDLLLFVWALCIHDDVIKWKHFPRYWPLVRGSHRSPVNSLHKGQWRGALMFSLICVRIKGRVNTREAGDLRRYRAHYDVIVMTNHTTVQYITINKCKDTDKKF